MAKDNLNVFELNLRWVKSLELLLCVRCVGLERSHLESQDARLSEKKKLSRQ